MTDLRAIAARLHAAYHLGDVQPDHPIRAAHDALIQAAAERDALRERVRVVEVNLGAALETATSLAAERDATIRLLLDRLEAVERGRDAMRQSRDHLSAAYDERELVLSRELAERDALRALLVRSRRYVEQDAQMMADLTRHSPLDASQAVHDSTEYESERLLPLIDAALRGEEG